MLFLSRQNHQYSKLLEICLYCRLQDVTKSAVPLWIQSKCRAGERLFSFYKPLIPLFNVLAYKLFSFFSFTWDLWVYGTWILGSSKQFLVIILADCPSKFFSFYFFPCFVTVKVIKFQWKNLRCKGQSVKGSKSLSNLTSCTKWTLAWSHRNTNITGNIFSVLVLLKLFLSSVLRLGFILFK